MSMRQTFLLLFPEECVDKYLLYGDYFDVGCFKAGLSKALGYGVIVGSSLGSSSCKNTTKSKRCWIEHFSYSA
ncbi:hypothetical protein P879_09843 [Paragonimus westermani]|uniref:Uncharacterized protein n=1 Tax=Paragonimus westermani TaxID=34504 RepID=A0A8T0DAF8_9TREM|nr:hypothetical protein P879_09843 [Paragonimus westermani]